MAIFKKLSASAALVAAAAAPTVAIVAANSADAAQASSAHHVVVKTGEQFLCTAEDGDIGMAPAVEDATSFLSYEEAEKAAHVHADPGYEIVAVCVLKH